MQPPGQQWFTVRDLATRLGLAPYSVRRTLRPFREFCHLGRNGRHPRKVLWVPLDVVLAIERLRSGAKGAALPRLRRGRDGA